MKVNELVAVKTAEGEKVGQVKYTRGGWVGVALVNEGGRVDEWQPSQVRMIDAKEAAKLVTK